MLNNKMDNSPRLNTKFYKRMLYLQACTVLEYGPWPKNRQLKRSAEMRFPRSMAGYKRLDKMRN